jgi:anti-anti-sigma factor
MRAEIVKQGGAWTLAMDGGLDVRNAAALHVIACEAVNAPAAVTLDLGAVEAIDVAGAQVLLALAAALDVRGVTLSVAAVPPRVVETWRQLGLEGRPPIA